MAADRAGTGVGVRVTDDPEVAVALGPRTVRLGTRVPIAFFGTGVHRRGTRARAPASTRSHRRSPQAIGLRPFARIRRSAPARLPTAWRACGNADAIRSLVVEIVWKGVGSADLEARPDAWPFLRATIAQCRRHARGNDRLAAGGPRGDPHHDRHRRAARPSTASRARRIRGDDGDGRTGRGAPGAPGLGHRDAGRRPRPRSSDQRARIAGRPQRPSTDRGLIGDGWYLDDRDRDDVVVSAPPSAAVAGAPRPRVRHRRRTGVHRRRASAESIRDGWIAPRGRSSTLVRAPRPVDRVRGHATGSLPSAGREVAAADRPTEVDTALGSPPIVASGRHRRAVPGSGGARRRRSITADAVVSDDGVADGRRTAPPLFADAFPSFAVAFSRYC